MEADASANGLLAEARVRDRERAICALFALPEHRTKLFGLILLNQELARIPDLVSDSMVGRIRFQWWRDALSEGSAGPIRDNPVIAALRPALDSGDLVLDDLLRLVDARENDLDAGYGVDAVTEVRGRAGAVQRLWAQVTGCRDADWLTAASDVGTAWGILDLAAGQRNRQGSLSALDRDGLLGHSKRLLAGLRARGRAPRTVRSALLPAIFARAEFRRLRQDPALPPRHGDQGLPPRLLLRLYAAALTGWV
jgi:Squalene/phytoene synthase